MKITERLVEYASSLNYEMIPETTIEAQKKSVIDSLGCMVAATGIADKIRAIPDTAKILGQEGPCTLLDGGKTTPVMAALANGALSHLLDYEDSHEEALVHPNAVSMPVMLALAEYSGGISGKQFLTALVVASDICCRLDLGAKEDLLKYGWNMPPICGGLGAIFGACNMLGLSKEQIQDAIALGLSQITASGEAANSKHSIIRSIRDGFAAQAAVLSVLLASQGIPARFDDAFEGSLGYYHAYARDQYDPEKVIDKLGEVFQSEMISFKPWPCCRATHTTIEGIQHLLEKHQISVSEITGIHLVLHEIGRMVLEPTEIKYHPKTVAMAKLSIPFAVGTLLKYGEITLNSFTAERLNDRDIEKLGSLVTYEFDPRLTKEQNKVTVVTIKTNRGSFTHSLNHPLGCRENPMSDEQFKEKFIHCFKFSKFRYSDSRIDDIYNAASRLEEISDVRSLVSLLEWEGDK